MSIIAEGSVRKVRGALIYVEDVERCTEFYRDVVGLRMLYRTPRFVRFDATEGTSIALIAGGRASEGPKDYRSAGTVPEIIVDDLACAVRRLEAAGAIHEPPVETAWGRFCIFFDREGNALQFYESAFVRPDEDPERIDG
ncbi:MAG: VOC family protein [Chloroflexota bacterium]|nr:VOC family protein [Chloroflexota bacterium]